MSADEPIYGRGMADLLEIQRQMATVTELVERYVQQTATPDPWQRLREFLEREIAAEGAKLSNNHPNSTTD